MELTNVLLSVIVVLLTFCALGAISIAEQKSNEHGNTLTKLAIFWSVIILGVIYLLF